MLNTYVERYSFFSSLHIKDDFNVTSFVSKLNIIQDKPLANAYFNVKLNQLQCSQY